MGYVRRVEVSGFWQDRTVEVAFDRDLNFLIGPNGSGKSTLIGLVGATLTTDLSALARMEFKEITIELGQEGSNRKPRIHVARVGRRRRIEFRVFQKAADREKDAFQLRLPGVEGLPLDFHPGVPELQAQVQALCPTVWLTVNRARYRSGDDAWAGQQRPITQSLVDQKVVSISEELSALNSRIRTRAEEENVEFQRQALRSLIRPLEPLTGVRLRRILSDDTLETSMRQTYSDLRIPKDEYEADWALILSSIEQVGNKGVRNEQVWHSFQLLRLLALVESRTGYVAARNQIFQRRDQFLQTMSKLLKRKSLLFNAENLLVFRTQSGKELPVLSLSSGEKQLLIMLGEALLRSSEEWVYIADEPEISLHMEWQAKIVSSVQRLSPGVQTILATHSPDVVAGRTDKLIRMEQVLERAVREP